MSAVQEVAARGLVESENCAILRMLGKMTVAIAFRDHGSIDGGRLDRLMLQGTVANVRMEGLQSMRLLKGIPVCVFDKNRCMLQALSLGVGLKVSRSFGNFSLSHYAYHRGINSRHFVTDVQWLRFAFCHRYCVSNLRCDVRMLERFLCP